MRQRREDHHRQQTGGNGFVEEQGPSPSGRGRRDSQRAGAPGEGRAKREPDRAKHKERSSQILRPSPSLEASPYRAHASRPLPEGEGGSSAISIQLRISSSSKSSNQTVPCVGSS